MFCNLDCIIGLYKCGSGKVNLFEIFVVYVFYEYYILVGMIGEVVGCCDSV